MRLSPAVRADGDFAEAEKLVPKLGLKNAKSLLYAIHKQQYLEWINGGEHYRSQVQGAGHGGSSTLASVLTMPPRLGRGSVRTAVSTGAHMPHAPPETAGEHADDPRRVSGPVLPADLPLRAGGALVQELGGRDGGGGGGGGGGGAWGRHPRSAPPPKWAWSAGIDENNGSSHSPPRPAGRAHREKLLEDFSALAESETVETVGACATEGTPSHAGPTSCRAAGAVG